MPPIQNLLQTLMNDPGTSPRVSIFLKKPDARLSDGLASIELYQRISEARRLLEESFSKEEATDYLRPLFQAVSEEISRGRPGTLAIFHSHSGSHHAHLEDSEPPIPTVVADSYHVKPLLLALQGRAEEEVIRDELARVSQALDSGDAAIDFFGVAQAFRDRNVETLCIASNAAVWGRIERKRGSVILHPRQLNDRDDDILDDFAEWGLREGVRVIVRPLHELPGQLPLIAVLKQRKTH